VGFEFVLLFSLIYVVIGIRVIGDVWRNRAQIFDDRLTPPERMQISQVAFFLLIPLSVALHELGHAIAVWAFGGEVIDFGFYFFAGFVSYAEPFSELQHLVVAAAGTIVNIIIGIAVLGFVFLKKPPMRAAYNELLITFAVLQGANALIFYPLLDFATDMNGDWRQMYSGDAGSWRWVVLAVHVGILAGAYLLSKQPRFRKRLGELTGMPPGVERGLMGGFSVANRGEKSQPRATPKPAKRLTLVEERLVSAAERVSSGWPGSVHHRLRSTPSASEVLMIWSDGATGVVRITALRALPDGSGEIWGLLFGAGMEMGPPMRRSRLERWDVLPDDNALTIALRVAMEKVGRWPVSSDAPRPSGLPE
jgi:hypothetical protein